MLVRRSSYPDGATGKVSVLIFGFTKASKVPTSAWGDKLNADFGTRPDFTLYQLPVLEDVPRLLRGMVISGIKKGLPENKREHFVPILQGEAELKKFVNYHEPDDAYLVVLGRKGETLAQTHGSSGRCKLCPATRAFGFSAEFGIRVRILQLQNLMVVAIRLNGVVQLLQKFESVAGEEIETADASLL